jgi:hypothetical protein
MLACDAAVMPEEGGCNMRTTERHDLAIGHRNLGNEHLNVTRAEPLPVIMGRAQLLPQRGGVLLQDLAGYLLFRQRWVQIRK